MSPRVRLVLIGLAACAAAAFGGTWIAASQQAPGVQRAPGTEFAGAIRPPGAMMPAFSLRDQDGAQVTAASLRGKPAVFTFIYSTCEDTCPLQVQQIRGALDDLGRDVQVIGVSVDPANDTPLRARRFMLEQHMTGRMTFLLGSERDLLPVWKAFGIAPQRGELDHSAYVVIVDGRGRQRIGFPASQLTIDGLAADLKRLGA
jgi:protein SCO1/2